MAATISPFGIKIEREYMASDLKPDVGKQPPEHKTHHSVAVRLGKILTLKAKGWGILALIILGALLLAYTPMLKATVL